MKEKRSNALYCDAFQLKGNDKLLDFFDTDLNIWFKYAQFNTIAGFCCPYASIGCALACYAKTGCHVFPSVKKSREKSYNASLEFNFSEKMIYTIETELESGRYSGNVMIIRIHESGDFYSFEYLLKWLRIFEHFKYDNRVIFCFYTKSFEYFLELSEYDRDIIRAGMEAGTIAMSLSLDDTTTAEQLARAMKLKEIFPLVNIYYFTDNPGAVVHDHECDCKDCARCGTCTHARGTITVVLIHSITEKQLARYKANKRK